MLNGKLVSASQWQNQVAKANDRLPPILTGELAMPPKILDVHLSSACDLACVYCNKTIDPRKLARVLNASNIVEILEKTTGFIREGQQIEEYHFAGDHTEPLLSPALLPGLQHIKERGRFSVLYTNGVSLTDKKISQILPLTDILNISLDAATRESFLRLKGKDVFGRVLVNIEKTKNYLDQMQLLMKFNISFVVQEQNIDHLLPFLIALDQLGPDHVFLRKDIHGVTPAFAGKIDHLMNEINALTLTHSDIVLKNHGEKYFHKTHCFSQVNWPALSYDGKIYPCGHTTKEGYHIGDLFKETLQEIWDRKFSNSHEPSQYIVHCGQDCAPANRKYNLKAIDAIMNDPKLHYIDYQEIMDLEETRKHLQKIDTFKPKFSGWNTYISSIKGPFVLVEHNDEHPSTYEQFGFAEIYYVDPHTKKIFLVAQSHYDENNEIFFSVNDPAKEGKWEMPRVSYSNEAESYFVSRSSDMDKPNNNVWPKGKLENLKKSVLHQRANAALESIWILILHALTLEEVNQLLNEMKNSYPKDQDARYLDIYPIEFI